MHFVQGKPPELQRNLPRNTWFLKMEPTQVFLGRPEFERGRACTHLAEFKVIPRPCHMTAAAQWMMPETSGG
jgi:hypothetical protein